jgi:hypothetical protein
VNTLHKGDDDDDNKRHYRVVVTVIHLLNTDPTHNGMPSIKI